MNDIEQQLVRFREAAARSARGHYKAAEREEAAHRWFGVPAVLLSAVVATSIFATLTADPAAGWKIVTGVLSLAAAALASLQTFLGHSERAREHRAAAAAYAALRREIELLDLRQSMAVTDPERSVEPVTFDELEQIRRRLDELGSSSPLIPPRAYALGVTELTEEAQDPEGRMRR